MHPPSAVVVYGRELCADTARSRALLDALGAPYRYVDVGANETARAEAVRLSGRTNLPVVVVRDEIVLVEPTDDELVTALAGSPSR